MRTRTANVSACHPRPRTAHGGPGGRSDQGRDPDEAAVADEGGPELLVHGHVLVPRCLQRDLLP
eukprot:14231225-Alexandrium_andersonii.AAC.1